MKTRILLLVVLLAPQMLIGQVVDPQFDKVAKRFSSGKYEAALERAESLIDKDKYRQEPELYLWAAMSLYELSKSEDPKVQELFHDPLRDALRHTGKAATKDREGKLLKTHAAFVDTMLSQGVKVSRQLIDAGDARKAGYLLKQMLNFASTNKYLVFANAVNDIRMHNYFDAQRAMSKVFPKLEQHYRDLDYKPDPITSSYFKSDLISYTDHLLEAAYQDSARKVLLSGRIFFPLDEEIKQRLQNLN